MTFTIEVQSQPVLDALNRLLHAGQDLNPVLRAIGEGMAERTKQGFQTGTAPDGTPWATNSDTTLRKMLHSNDKNFTKKGALSKRGTQVLSGKRPLIGESGRLSSQIAYEANADSVTIFSTMKYAAMQQFGGKKSQFPNLWGDIPARPFLPVTRFDTLYPNEEDEVLKAINAHLFQALDR